VPGAAAYSYAYNGIMSGMDRRLFYKVEAKRSSLVQDDTATIRALHESSLFILKVGESG
jgi:hypothetical protein